VPSVEFEEFVSLQERIEEVGKGSPLHWACLCELEV
jgi:hypothetical protein